MTPEQLYEQHEPIAVSIANKHRGRVPYDDRMQEAKMALWKCAMRWKPEGGAKFSSYSYHRVRGALIDADRQWCGEIRAGGQRLLARGVFFDSVQYCDEEHDHGSNAEPTIDSEEEAAAICAAMPKRHAHIISLLADGLTGREVAAAAGISPSRISQIIAEARQFVIGRK